MMREGIRKTCGVVALLCAAYVPFVLICAPSEFGVAYARSQATIALCIGIPCLVIRLWKRKEKRNPNQVSHGIVANAPNRKD